MSRDALVVGINTYQHLPSLNAPANDAESVARCLERFGECRVLRMPEGIQNHKPALNRRAVVTTQMLEESLIRLFKPTGKNIPQTAIFYYSGHGLQRNAGIQEGFLAPSDVNPAAGHYGLSLYWLRRLLQESPVRQRVIILDCCNSGEFFNIIEADPGSRSGTDRLFMAASREYEEAYESLEGSHSVFTQALLSGLNPYKIKGGLVNGHTLTDTVARQLKGELQQPLFESSGGEITLTRLSGGTRVVQSSPVSTLDRLKQLSYGFCPFQGAAPFEASRASLFFGREAFTETLIQQVTHQRFCAIVGASGSGKTSILQAGLMAQLPRRSAPEVSWTMRYLTPGTTPLRRLAEAFIDQDVQGVQRAEQIRAAEAFLRRGNEGLTELLQAMLPAPPETQPSPRLLLVIDQFEDLFSPSTQPNLEAERQIVVDCLLAAIHQDHLPLHVVLGLRADYLGSLQRFGSLYGLVVNQGLTVPTMTYDQVKSTIVGPLDKMGLHYDANLVYTLLLDVVGAPGDLALLQMALKAVWQKREMRPNDQEPPRLTLEAYAEMGGIRHLLSQQVNGLYDRLSRAEQPIAERILMSLCEVGEGGTLTRRQVQLPELITEAMDQVQVLGVLNQLVAARLVVAQASAGEGEARALAVPGWLGHEGNSSLALAQQLHRMESPYFCRCPDLTPYFDIAHESLIRTWLATQVWLQNSLSRLRQQRTIETAAQEWYRQQCPHHPEYFLTKARLAEAQRLQLDHPDSLSTQASAYLRACQTYARRAARKRHLMKLLVPISMATGMLAAYGHSLVAQPSLAWKQGSGVPATTTPTFRALPDHPPPPTMGTLPTPPPQAGMVRSHLLGLVVDRLAATEPAMAMVGPSSSLTDGLYQAEQGAQGWPAVAADLAPPPIVIPQIDRLATTAPATALPIQADQLTQVAEWISPQEPTQKVQVWCLQNSPVPTCFTIQGQN